MIFKIEHSISKLAVALIVLALILPSTLSLAHSFQDHEHIDQCELVGDLHMHEKKLDCEMDHLAIQKATVFAFAKANFTPIQITQKIPANYYRSWNSSERGIPESRGPPYC